MARAVSGSQKKRPATTKNNNESSKKARRAKRIPKGYVVTKVVDHFVKEKTLEVMLNNSIQQSIDPLNESNHLDNASFQMIIKYLQDVYVEQTESGRADERIKDWKLEIEVKSRELLCARQQEQHQENLYSGRNKIELDLGQYGFCCAKCNCDKPSTFVSTSGKGGVWHRNCCHGLPDKTEINKDWKAPADVVAEEIGDIMCGERTMEKKKQLFCTTWTIKAKDAKEISTTAKRKEKSIKSKIMQTKTQQNLVSQQYEKCLEALKNHEPERATVFSLWSGYGSLIVALKRLGIDMKRVIHIEPDKVANHVIKYNHMAGYNSSAENDGIEHHFPDNIQNLQNFDVGLSLRTYFPIDIVVGNISMMGETSKNEEIFLSIVDAIQKNDNQRGRPVFVYLETPDGSIVKNVTSLDLQMVSPYKRRTNIYLNYPLDKSTEVKPSANINVNKCIDNGFGHPLGKSYGLYPFPKNLDDERMMVMQKSKDATAARTMTVREREKMVGLPEGHISAPLHQLFDEVQKACFMRTLSEGRWTEAIDKKFHCLAGSMPKLEYNPELEPYIKIRVPIAISTKKIYLDEHQYGKYLIGNAASMLLAEIYLKPLQKLFKNKSYSKFQYSYVWGEDNVKEEETTDNNQNAANDNEIEDGQLANTNQKNDHQSVADNNNKNDDDEDDHNYNYDDDDDNNNNSDDNNNNINYTEYENAQINGEVETEFEDVSCIDSKAIAAVRAVSTPAPLVSSHASLVSSHAPLVSSSSSEEGSSVRPINSNVNHCNVANDDEPSQTDATNELKNREISNNNVNETQDGHSSMIDNSNNVYSSSTENNNDQNDDEIEMEYDDVGSVDADVVDIRNNPIPVAVGSMSDSANYCGEFIHKKYEKNEQDMNPTIQEWNDGLNFVQNVTL